MKRFIDIGDVEICVDDTEKGENSLLLIQGLTALSKMINP